MKKILIAPLCWGLGHATRCMPVIDAFLEQGAEVILASDGDALGLLKAEYPQLKHLELPPYNIHYKTGNMFLNIAPQVPKILNAIRKEQKALLQIVQEYKIDAVISDNRYGLYHPQIPTVLITHQLNIAIPNRWVAAWIANLNQKYIKKFTMCWVPDKAEEPSLAGNLSHNTLFQNIVYIGLLSRMQWREEEKKYDIIAVLSGPEPQRSILEQKIIAQTKTLSNQKILIVSGKTAKKTISNPAPQIEVHSYMTKNELNEALLQSKVVITRSGYSTIMDLEKLRCEQVLLIPTPGQTEQEYLAERLCKQKKYLYQTQKELDINLALEKLQYIETNTRLEIAENLLLNNVIKDFLYKLAVENQDK